VKTGKTRPAPSIEEIDAELSYLKAHLGEEAVNSFTGEYVYMRLNAPNTKLELKEEFMQIGPVYENKDEESGSELDEVEEFDIFDEINNITKIDFENPDCSFLLGLKC
jgi:hypothetical protein